MRSFSTFLGLLLCFFTQAQTYPSYNISLLAHINPNTDTASAGGDGRFYSGCWGWYQASNNREYAISGTSNGTYFIDITVPSSPSVCAFVPGKPNCTWRELKTYQNYCYIISDDSSPNTFQIVDMSTLPATVTVVHNDTTIFERGHTIWIDQDKMYIGGAGYVGHNNPKSMALYSLATPTAPVLLKFLSDDVPSIGYVHDMYVRNDTIYASAAFQGLYVCKYNSVNNTFTQLGNFSNYAAQGYNHSSYLTQNGKYLAFCDEIPDGMPIRLVDVQNLLNIQPTSTFIPASHSTPHNPYILGNNFAVVSSYQDGLVIYNISNPAAITLAGYFDTYPQGGFAQNDYTGTYRGNWGAYPFLPSGLIVANDMQNGVFILNPSAAYTNTLSNPVSLEELADLSQLFQVYPNPSKGHVWVTNKTGIAAQLAIYNLMGACVKKAELSGSNESLDCTGLDPGVYTLVFSSGKKRTHQKFILQE